MGEAEKEYAEKLKKLASLILKHDEDYARDVLMIYIDEYWNEGEIEKAEKYLSKIDDAISSAFDKEV